ncbi:lipid II flippase MurJ [Streptomyces sp. enrichment culture]|uniref:lipid II flippase MurJ n=1 Tax=Streptomyces sp. enrichment culture TaxID=1795815 RepID=UPI003F556153
MSGGEGGGVLERPSPGGGADTGSRFVARAATLTAALAAGGALFGLLRDQMIARLFGADGATDAFLVSWTLPEFASTLLIEEAMALVLVPAFSVALARRAAAGSGGTDENPGPDPVRRLLADSLPRVLLGLAVAATLAALAAPLLVRLLAPGLADPALAVDCTRLTAVTVLTFGIAGYFSAALRAHRSYLAPAAIYIGYNIGIIATALALHARFGVRAAALGVAVGGALMVLLQLPFFLRKLPVRGAWADWRARRRTAAAGGRPYVLGVTVALVAPIALFAISRQAQVLVERFLASSLTPGAISHLNYAQKVSQIPMVLALMIPTVTLPLVARAMAEGDTQGARRRVERDLLLVGIVAVLGAAYVMACAPHLVQLLFQRGEFTAEATAATAEVMRVYALGLLGHTLVGALIRPFFSAARPTWFPLAAMGVGLAITVVAGAVAVRYWGAAGIAAANAAGITATALLLMRGLAGRVVPIDPATVMAGLGRLLLSGLAAGAAGWAVADATGSPLLSAALAALAVPAVFAAGAWALRVPEAVALLSAAQRKLKATP